MTLLISIPIWTHRLPPISDYVNHLARMDVIATLAKNPQLAHFYEINWQVIPNLTMDLIVPLLARFMNVYLAGQIYPGRHVRAHHLRRPGAQPRAVWPLVGAAAVRHSAAVQLRLPRRADELHLRHRRRAVGAGRLGGPARARLAAAHDAVGRLHRRAVLLPSLGAGHLRHRPAVVRTAAAVAAAARAVAGTDRGFRRQRLAVPGGRAIALCQPDHAARVLHRLGAGRQDRRADVRHLRLFRHRRLRADRGA